MKKILLLAVLFFFGFIGIAQAQTWHTANQVTVAWDAVTTLSNGDPIPSGDSISYNIYIKLEDGTNLEHVGTTNMLTHTITFNAEGRYFIGFQTVRVPEGETEQQLSATVWSSDPAICANNEDFGVKFFLAAGTVTGVRLQ